MLKRRDFLKTFGALSLYHVLYPSGLFKWGKEAEPSRYPNILILVLDALTASRMSLYGCPRDTTPNINSLAAKSNVYHRHYAGGNFTTPGTASLLTGTYPWSHRSYNMFGSILKEQSRNNIFEVLPRSYFKFAYTQNPLAMIFLDQFKGSIDILPELKTTSIRSDAIANWFQQDFTAAFWGETIIRARDKSYLPSTLFISLVNKFCQALYAQFPGKNIQDYYPRGIPHNYQGSSFLLEDAVDWLKTQIRSYSNPFFSYIHLWPPHEPYFPRKDFINIFSDGGTILEKPEHFFSTGKTSEQLMKSQTMYDEYLKYTDSEIGRLLDFMGQGGYLNNTILIITSDHGQAFERGIEGHLTPVLYESLVRIPLIMSMPGQKVRNDFYVPTSAVDILPTILEVTGQPIPGWCEGQVLPGIVNSKEQVDRNIFIVEAKENSKFGPLQHATLGLIHNEYKLIRYIGYEGYENQFECYNLIEDPNELDNLYPSDPITHTLKEMLEDKLLEVNQRHPS